MHNRAGGAAAIGRQPGGDWVVSASAAPAAGHHRAVCLAMRLQQRLLSGLLFFAPFAVLLVLWAVLVPYFNVNPRLFPTLGSVREA